MMGSECDHDGEIGEQLRDLIQRTDALTAVLLTRDGRCVSSAGDTAQVNTTALSVFVAEMVSGARAVARVVGEDRFSTVLQHGDHRHVHLTWLNDAHVLVVVFEDDRETGLVRLQARRTAESLAGILPTQPSAANDETGPERPRRGVDPIERIFRTQERMESDPHAQ